MCVCQFVFLALFHLASLCPIGSSGFCLRQWLGVNKLARAGRTRTTPPLANKRNVIYGHVI